MSSESSSNNHKKNTPEYSNNDVTCCAASRKESNYLKPINAPHGKYRKTGHIGTGKMILIPKGIFLMGTESEMGFPQDGEGPIREVELDPFYIDETAVTNEQFLRFIKSTGYTTEAEIYGWSFVFHSLIPEYLTEISTQSPLGTPWWKKVDGANWQNPQGPGTNIESIMDHPVVHISWNDASEYCSWSGKRLPTEAEWEYAARSGLTQNIFPWGNDLTPNGVHMCNIWQGEFPTNNTKEDGFIGTAPVKSFYPNEFGLYNMVGNVWEWQSDWFSTIFLNKNTLSNPSGPSEGTAKTIKGGSYLCHESYCNRYRVAARSSNTPDSSTGNLGFRCVKSAF